MHLNSVTKTIKKYMLLIILFAILFVIIDLTINNQSSIKPLSGKAILNTNSISTTNSIKLQTFMCRVDNCPDIFIETFNHAEKRIDCAFFEFEDEKMLTALKNNKNQKNISIRIYVDGQNYYFNDSFIQYENRSSFMHNKFCIIDNDIVLTGSFNPTISQISNADNNLVIIKSNELATIYANYFTDLLKDHVQRQKNYQYQRQYTIQDNTTTIQVCFSPKGNCLALAQNTLNKTKNNIQLMQFSMTDDILENIILAKYYSNISVKGIFETRSIDKYSAYHGLVDHIGNSSIIKDCNEGTMHHKVIIIDNTAVIAGSFNPSNNAELRNDENMIIIENKDIAKTFLNEFKRVGSICQR